MEKQEKIAQKYLRRRHYSNPNAFSTSSPVFYSIPWSPMDYSMTGLGPGQSCRFPDEISKYQQHPQQHSQQHPQQHHPQHQQHSHQHPHQQQHPQQHQQQQQQQHQPPQHLHPSMYNNTNHANVPNNENRFGRNNYLDYSKAGFTYFNNQNQCTCGFLSEYRNQYNNQRLKAAGPNEKPWWNGRELTSKFDPKYPTYNSNIEGTSTYGKDYRGLYGQPAPMCAPEGEIERAEKTLGKKNKEKKSQKKGCSLYH